MCLLGQIWYQRINNVQFIAGEFLAQKMKDPKLLVDGKASHLLTILDSENIPKNEASHQDLLGN